jgi:ankyrin repeat protein
LEFVLEHQVDHSISEPGQLKSINSTLVQAIKLRDIQQIRTCLIADPTLLNLQDENFESVLHVACSLGFENETRILIASGANINAKNGHNHSPLSRAILAGHSQIAKMLLEKGADTTFVDAADQTLLHQACMKGMTGVVAAILATLPTLKPQEGGIPFLEMLDFTGVTALTWACGLGHTEVARMLLHAGAKPTMLSVGTDDRRCPTIACLPKSPGDGVKILQLLTDAGLDLYDLDWQGNTPLHNVSWVGRVDLAQPIIAALTVAGMIDKMLALANSSGRTPLFLAMAHDHADMCQLLLQHGADPSFMNETPGQHDFYGLTPFDFACEEGHTNSVRVMLGHGRDLGETRKGLFLAARAGHLETCKLLLAHKVDSNYSHDYWTTLYAAARFGHVEIVRVLLDHGARAWPTIDSATRFNFRTRGSDVQTQSMIISLLESKGIFQGNTFLSVLSAKIFGDLFG